MPLRSRDPSGQFLIQIDKGSGEEANRRSLRWLSDHQLAKARPGREESRAAVDWELTREGQKAVQDLLEAGFTYLPEEFGAERAKFERSLDSLGLAKTEPPPPGAIPAEIAVATWNLYWNSDPESTLAYLESAPWDIVCLQEVGIMASNRLAEHKDWSVVNGLALAWHDGISTWQRPHGAALVARNGWRLEGATLMADNPTPGRGVSAVARRDEETVSVVSWHAPNAVPGKGETKAEAVVRKMDGYHALGAHLASIDGPLIVGMDANHWNLETALDLPAAPPESDPFYPQALFFSADAQHGLRDTLLVELEANPAKHEELKQLRPEGPLEVTHARGGHGVPDRFDYLMISNEFGVDETAYDYEGARDAGSDHGWVSATLRRA
jgi:hypothetical protein